MIKVQKVYYCEYDHWVDENGEKCCRAHITTSEDEAKKLDRNYKLAKIDQVLEFISLGFDVIPVIEVAEGVYGWYEQSYISEFDTEEVYVGYVWMQYGGDWEINNWVETFERQMKEK